MEQPFHSASSRITLFLCACPIAPAEILEAKLSTIVGGKIVWERAADRWAGAQ